MSRETKVGLVVSCSFLCLVGIVVFCKLQQGGPAGATATAEEKLDATAPPTPTKESAPAPEGTKPDPAVVASVPGAGNLEPAKQVEPLRPVPGPIQQTAAVEDKGAASPSILAPPPPPSFTEYNANNHSSTRTGNGSADSPAPAAPDLPTPAPPAPAPAAATPMPPPPAPSAPDAPPLPSPVSAALPQSGGAAPKPPEKGDHEFVGPPAPPADQRPKTTKAPAAEENPLASNVPGGGKGSKDGRADNPKDRTTAVEPPAPPVPPAAPLKGTEPPASGDKNPSPPAPPPVPAPALPMPAPAEPTKPPVPPEPVPAAPPHPDTGASLGKPVPPAAEKTEPPVPPAPAHVPTPAPAGDDAPPQIKLGSPGVPPANQFAQGPTPSVPAPARPLPPVGAVPAATSPPLVVPPAPAAHVNSYDEETYHCRPGDTFESVSRAKYQSARYAQALLLYNRELSLSGDSFQGGVSTLRPGQAILLPPADILEKRFGAAIKDSGPAPRPTAAPATAPGPAAGVAYRVRGRGEYLRAVAMRALGDSERWQEILQLNPSVNLAVPVPAGTLLRLPADARVPAENLP